MNYIFKSLQEIRIVSENNDEIVIIFSTDLGFLNSVIKTVFTCKKIDKVSICPADLVYSLVYRNSIYSIISVLRYIFMNDLINFIIYFFVKSINFNLVMTCKIKVQK